MKRTDCPSRLAQWPCQIRLVPPNAPYLEGADLLIAADCTAYAYAAFHEQFMKDRITLITCPRLDAADYSEKLAEILHNNSIRSLLVLRMETNCCNELALVLDKVLKNVAKEIPIQVVTISTDGKIIGKIGMNDLNDSQNMI